MSRPRKRDRVKRAFFLLVALCVLAFLLELNRWLPGTWPGGGGGGVRAAGEFVKTPERAREPADVDDPGAVAPPREPPPSWPPPAGIVVEVRGPDGSLETGWTLGSGSGGAQRPGADGRLRSGDARAREKGFRVGLKAGKLRHEHGVNAHVAAWSIHVPAAKLPSQRDGGRAGLRIVDAVSGQPIPGAVAEWRARGRKQTSTADATGEAVVKPEYGGRATRVRVSAAGYATQHAWASPRDARLREVRLSKYVTRFAQFTPAGGAPMQPMARITPYDANGRRLIVPPMAGREPGIGNHVSVPQLHADTAWVEVETTSGYIFRMRFRDIEGPLPLPAAKELSVHVRDVNGAAVPSARVWAEIPTESEGGPHRFEGGKHNGVSATEMPARFPIPDGRAFKLRVEVPGKAPIVRSFASMDGNAPLELVAEDGLMIPVRVVNEANQPLPGARVIARASVEGVRIVRAAQTGPDGRADLGPFARGPLEIFATAAGRAWSAVLAEAKPAVGTTEIRLQAGYPVHLVVEDPYGVPLDGVDVELSPVEGRPLVSPPPPVNRTTDAGGRLTIGNVPNGLYAVRLTRDGHHSEVLRNVQPGAVTYFATLVPK